MIEPTLSKTSKKIERVDLLWLAYLIFFIIEPIERKSTLYWIECLAILLAFTCMYFVFLRTRSHRLAYCLLGAMWVLGVATLPMNGGGTTFLIYTAALLPYAVGSVTVVFGTLMINALALALEGHWLHFHPWSIFLNIFFLLVVGFSNQHFAQQRRANCKLQMKQEEIEALAAVAERERIARDLHDVLGHTLSVIVLKSELAGRLLQREIEALEAIKSLDPLEASQSLQAPAGSLTRARAEIADVESTARTALAEVREAIGGYRARGLGAEIEAARQTLSTAGVMLATEGNLQPTDLSVAEETVLALALREAVTNIVRHAQATECRLRLVNDASRYRLSIADNGRHITAREGNGLRGMRERVESLGGQLSLTRGDGTQLLIELPLRSGAAV